MPRANLTDLFIRKIAPDERTIYWDEALPAFGVRVGARSKVFIVIRGQARKKTTIGKYPALSLQDARRKAGALIFSSAQDEFPSTTLARAVGTFLQTHAARERTIAEYDRLIRRHFLPQLGAKSLGSIRTRDITGVTDALASTPAEQIHAHAALSAFFSWALGRQLVAANPMQHLALPSRPAKRDRTLGDGELVRVYRAAQEIRHPFGFIVLICIHTGIACCRATSSTTSSAVIRTTW